ncbi:autotransporter-associated beta strand repeat-containing protein, partial [uncultured Nitratireductor sp.]|uniref:beta strand repeat-containing protein n=1 Tax=uncultured Nitratireductor sp. TaxID=520953 RepID=UPI0025FFD1A9
MHFDLSKNAGADERRGVILRRNTGLRALASGVSVLAVAGTVPALGVVALLATPAAAQEIQSGGGAGGNADPASGGGAGGAGGVAGGGGAGGHSVYGSAAIGGDGGAGALPGQPAQDGGKGDDDGRAFGGAGGQSGGTDLSAGGGGGGEAGHDDGNFADDGKDGGNGGSGSAHASTDVTLTGRTTGSNGISSVWAGAGGGGGAVVLTGSGSVATNDNLVIGGDGGTGHSGGGGGAGIVTVDGGDIWVIGGWVAGGAGGGGSYGGGQGGAGVFLHDGGLLDNTGTVAGGPGGGGGSRGGQGGVGALINDGTVINAARIIGGAGGDAYDGGVGGHGLMTYGGTITNQAGATITGGAGGASTMSTYVGGNAGAGVVFVDEANGGSLENFGAISGGAGGANTDTGTPGAGGVGVIVQDDNVTLVNSGTISGGLSGHAAAGQVRANALEIDGAGNTLEMHAGYGFEGNVVSSGAGNTLALGGAADSSFDVGTIGGSGQYQGFDAFEKTGTSTWVLTGTTTEKTPWTLNEGALIVGDGSHPGAGIAGTVTVENGATLGGAGTVGSTTIADGGILAPGNSIGTLTVDGDLALSSGSMLDYELGHPGSSAGAPGTSDRIDVAGDLTLDGTLDLADAGGAGFGYYRLMTYGGTLADNTLDIGATPSLADSAAYEIQPGGGNVDLLVAPRGSDTLQHWQGGDGTWGASNRNWLNIGKDAPPSGLPVTWAGNNAVFKNEPGGFNGGTILVVGTQNFKSLQFVDEGYRLEGSWTLRTVAGGSEIRVLADRAVIATDITGNGAIRKTEAGTLLLEGPNSYAGGTELLAGAVEVAEDASLGAASGGLTFNGGTLRVMETSFSETDRTIVWGGHGGGFDIADADNTFTVGQDLADGGDLHKKGAGTLVLQGTNSYGNTAVAAGALIGDADAISGSILNAGTITFNQAGNARFAGDIAGLNGTDGRMVKDGTGTLTLAGTSALDWTIRSGGLTTAAERFAGDAAIGANATFTLDQQADAQFAGTLSGAGAFDKTGAGTLLYTGDGSAFTGTTTVAGGLLNVGTRDDAAVLGGTIAMQAGARLGGFGTVGDTTLASGATVAPGNSIGTLTIDGDIAFDAGSTYEVETAPAGTDSDMIHATGTATLNGAGVAHSVLDGSAYDPFATYTILTADGGIDGTFGDITSSYAFLTPELFYGANSVDLELTRNDTDFAARARTFNQKAAARGIESLGQGNALYNAVAVLP